MKKFYFSFINLLRSPIVNLFDFFQNRSIRKLNKKGVFSMFFECDSFRIKYWKGGDGPVILFLHGFGGDALLSWSKELMHFAKDHTVIAPDLIWFGESYSSMWPELRTQRIAISKLLKHLKIESAIIVGQSYGGFLAIDIIMKEPLSVDKLCIANCPGPTFDLKELENVCKNFKVKNIVELFVLREPKEIQRLIDLSSYKNLKIPNRLLIQMYRVYFDKYTLERRRLMRSLMIEQSKYHNSEILKQQNTLVIWGENDELFSVGEGKRFAQSINASFVSIQKCGHAPQLDQPKKFLRLLVEFID